MRGHAALRLLASLGFLLIAAAQAWPQPAETNLQPGEAFALELRDHVVRIRAQWPSGETQEGFGFVVGENQSGAYVVTANHVVRGELPDQVAKEVMLTWFRRSGEEFPAVLLGTHEERRDLAVLRTKLPEGLLLRPELMRRPSGRLGRSTRVWYVGRASEWYVPSQPGTVDGIDLDEEITLDGLNVQVGTSGAPLVTDGGIAGMIISDTIGGVARAIDVSFIERALQTWNHPWNLVAPVEASAPVASATTDASETKEPAPLPGSPRGTRLIEPRGTTLVAPAQSPLAPPLEPIASPPPPAGLDAAAVLSGLAAFAPRPPGTTTAGTLTLRDVSVAPDGANELELGTRADFGAIDLGQVRARITPGEVTGTVDVGLEPEGRAFGIEIDQCRASLAPRDIHLTWDVALASFVDTQIELDASAVVCPDLDVAVHDVRLDMGFEAGKGERWDGWLEASIQGLVMRACDGPADSCEAARAAGFALPWQGPLMVEKGDLQFGFEGADLASRMAALAGEPEDFWPRHAVFAAPVLDPAVAAAGLIEPARVADYLGSVSANLSISGVKIAIQGIEATMEVGKAELEPGLPARFSYDVTGATVTAPGLPPTVQSNARVEIESTGRLDPASLLRGDVTGAVAHAAPFAIGVSTTNALGRIEGTGSVAAERESGLALLAADATVTTGDPVSYLLQVFLAPMAAQASNPAALQQAIAEVVALTPTELPLEPGREQQYHIRYEPLTGSVTVNGQSAAVLVGAFKDACLRYAC